MKRVTRAKEVLRYYIEGGMHSTKCSTCSGWGLRCAVAVSVEHIVMMMMTNQIYIPREARDSR